MPTEEHAVAHLEIMDVRPDRDDFPFLGFTLGPLGNHDQTTFIISVRGALDEDARAERMHHAYSPSSEHRQWISHCRHSGHRGNSHPDRAGQLMRSLPTCAWPHARILGPLPRRDSTRAWT